MPRFSPSSYIVKLATSTSPACPPPPTSYFVLRTAKEFVAIGPIFSGGHGHGVNAWHGRSMGEGSWSSSKENDAGNSGEHYWAQCHELSGHRLSGLSTPTTTPPTTQQPTAKQCDIPPFIASRMHATNHPRVFLEPGTTCTCGCRQVTWSEALFVSNAKHHTPMISLLLSARLQYSSCQVDARTLLGRNESGIIELSRQAVSLSAVGQLHK